MEAAGKVAIQIDGYNVFLCFKNEPGKHVVQRIPPTERNGRRQTSVITVAITSIFDEIKIKSLPSNEVEITAQVAGGKGGQNRNKVASAIRAVHKPTGLNVYICNERDQSANKKLALRILANKVSELKNKQLNETYTSAKRSQVGDGGRSDKARTYNFFESRVTDHRLNIKTRNVDSVMKGGFEIFYARNADI